MAELTLPAHGPYRLIAERFPTSPVMLKAILESWCILNCTGAWDATEQSLDLHSEDDTVLFMLSSEYGYIGNPPVKALTNL
jgi:hypothetical protein